MPSAVLTFAALASCVSGPDHVVELENALVLRVDLPVQVTSGDRVDALFTLRNVSQVAVTACFGEGKGYHLVTLQPTRVVTGFLGPANDHSICAARLELAPGAAQSWPEKLRVDPGIGLGSVGVSAWVEIVSPRECSPKFGCYSTLIYARRVWTTVVAPLNEPANSPLQQSGAPPATRNTK